MQEGIKIFPQSPCFADDMEASNPMVRRSRDVAVA